MVAREYCFQWIVDFACASSSGDGPWLMSLLLSRGVAGGMMASAGFLQEKLTTAISKMNADKKTAVLPFG